MFIYILILIAILFFLSWNLGVNNRVTHLVTSTIFSILFILGVLIATANFHDHAFMHKLTTTETSKQVNSMSPKMNMVLNQFVGTAKKEVAVIYKNGNKRVVLKPDTDIKNEVVQKKNIKTPKLVTTTTRWKYNSKFSKLMFDNAQKQTVDYQKHILYVPESWLVITPTQAKAMPQIMKKLQAQMMTSSSQSQMQAMAKAKVQQAVMSAMKKNPKMTSRQKAQVVKQATKEYKQQAEQNALQKMMPMLKKELAKVK